jgi:hypothetical protein
MNILNKLLNSKDPQELLDQAIQAFKNKEYKRARSLLDQGVKLFPGIARIIFWHGILNLSITDLRTIFDHPLNAPAAMEMNQAVALYEREQAGLEKDELTVAYIVCFRFALNQKDLKQACIICEKVLSLYPTDDYFLPKLVPALVQLNADPDQIEKWSRQALDLNLEMAENRRTWKKARKMQGKNFYSDRLENEKQAIYLLYAETKNIASFKVMEERDVLSTFKKVTKIDNYAKIINECYQVGAQVAFQTVTEKYQVSPFELELIKQEGETESWSIGSAALSTKGGSHVQMRDSINCEHCSGVFAAPYWPAAGNTTGFYYESAERVKEAPGKYRLPVKCPHCSTTWYVVWDETPGDPIGQHFLHHFERMIEHSPELKDVIHRLVTDEVFGRTLKFFKECVKEAAKGKQEFKTISFTYEDDYHLVTYSPYGSLQKTRSLFANYTQYLIRGIGKDAPEGIVEKSDYFHWIYCLSPEEEISNVQFAMVPSFIDHAQLPVVLPSEFIDDATFNQLVDWLAQYVPEKIGMTIQFDQKDLEGFIRELNKIFAGLGFQPSSFGLWPKLGMSAGVSPLDRALIISGEPAVGGKYSFEISRDSRGDARVKSLMAFLKIVLTTK